ncbi:MAG: type I secretion C-terminal target domain-containing protein [Methylobacteriaceae bacterium]|nr:type I secretion C-terminal target domain-containing protein [Methylobacteriaceae bacterium]
MTTVKSARGGRATRSEENTTQFAITIAMSNDVTAIGGTPSLIPNYDDDAFHDGSKSGADRKSALIPGDKTNDPDLSGVPTACSALQINGAGESTLSYYSENVAETGSSSLNGTLHPHAPVGMVEAIAADLKSDQFIRVATSINDEVQSDGNKDTSTVYLHNTEASCCLTSPPFSESVRIHTTAPVVSPATSSTGIGSGGSGSGDKPNSAQSQAATFQIFDPSFTRDSNLLGGYASDISIYTSSEIQLMSGQRFFQGGPITHYGTITILGSNLFSSFGASNPGLHGIVNEIDIRDLSGNLACSWSGMTLDASFLTPFPQTDPSQEIISAGTMPDTTFPLTVIGGQGDADLYGNLGDDTINAAGNDHIDGVAGVNTIHGGAGHNVIVDYPLNYVSSGPDVIGGYIDGGSGFSTLQLNGVNILEIDDVGGRIIWKPGDPTIRAEVGAAVTVKAIESTFLTFSGTVSVVNINEINGIRFGSALSGQVVLGSATEHITMAADTTVATFTDSDTTDVAGGFAATINWGDGTSASGTVTGSNGSFSVSGGHTYADEGTSSLTVTITRSSDNTQIAPAGNVAIGENDQLAPHGMTIKAASNELFNGVVAAFSDTDTVSAVGDFTASINWGDGTPLTVGTVSGSNGVFQVSGAHTYSTATTEQYVVIVTMSDDAPGTATATANSTVNFLFTSGSDQVDFNNLLPDQITAINAGADLYHSLDGNDVVTLPNVANYQRIGTVTWDPAQTFVAGNGNDRITGGDGNDSILVGSGQDIIYGSPGNDTLTGGSGQDRFDYQHGAFANFAGFSIQAPTAQTIVGGHASFQTNSGLQDTILLPGSPNDYTLQTKIGANWTTTTTTISVKNTANHPTGLPPVTITTSEVEKVQFANPLTNQVVLTGGSLTGGSLIDEMAALAADAYHDYNFDEVSRNWHPLSAIELGIAPSGLTDGGHYTYTDGKYDAISLLNDENASVMVGIVNQVPTLSIAFRGTDQIGDIPDYFPFVGAYLNNFYPLIDYIKQYITGNDISQVLVSGHSLGGAFAQIFMNENLGLPPSSVKGFTWGSPGAEITPSNANMEDFEHVNDPVPGTEHFTVLQKQAGAEILIHSTQVNGAIESHLMGYDPGAGGAYFSDTEWLVKLAQDSKNYFSKTALAASLVAGTPYTGHTVQIMPGNPSAPFEQLAPLASDNFVVGGDGNDQIHLSSLNSLIAAGDRVIDGGGGYNVLFVPFSPADYVESSDGQGGTILKYAIGGGTTYSVGTLYNIQAIIYGDGTIQHLDGAIPKVQTPSPGQTSITVDHSFDFLDAGNGNLTITGSGLGGDIVALGSGSDVVNETGGGNTIFVKDATTAAALTINAGQGNNTIITGAGDAHIVVGDGNNTIDAGTGNDTIILGNGNDTVNGGGGSDTIVGGAGNDTFVFDAAALASAQFHVSADITNYDQGGGSFNSGQGDQIDLSAILSVAYNQGNGLPISELVHVIEDPGGTFATVQVDPTGSGDGPNWVTVARLDGVQPGDSINVVLDPSQPLGVVVLPQPDITTNLGFSGDFNGDGTSDILWRNDNGDLGTWELSNGQKSSGTDLGVVPLSWHVVGVGDFNHDGTSDILWRNDNGDVGTWEITNGLKSGGTDLGVVPMNWHVAGVGDFNHDGTSDILWRNDNGDVGTWEITNGLKTGGTDLGVVPNAWHIVGVGDFNGDGTSDILWRNDNGDLGTWEIANGMKTGGTDLGVVPLSWHVVGVGDFNHDGTSDILWRSDNGDVGTWEITNGLKSGGTDLGVVSLNWHNVGVGTFDQNGNSLIPWLNTNGDLGTWELTNGLKTGGTDLGAVSDHWNISNHHFELV